MKVQALTYKSTNVFSLSMIKFTSIFGSDNFYPEGYISNFVNRIRPAFTPFFLGHGLMS